jgi:hypothetical protein
LDIKESEKTILPENIQSEQNEISKYKQCLGVFHKQITDLA